MNKVFRRPLDGALFMFDKGFKLFPLRANSKLPMLNDWQGWASTATRKKIESFGTANPTANWGVHTEDLTVVDIDQKEGKHGAKSRIELEAQGKRFPETFTVITSTGGLHLYYRKESKNINSGIAKDIDTKSTGGYVVAPGSKIDDKTYEIQIDQELPDCPEWLFLELTKEKEVLVLDDNELVEEGSRNQTLTSLAGTMRARGMQYEAILAALIAVNEHQFSTPLAEEEVETIARSISRYQPNDAKVAADFIADGAVDFKTMTANQIKPDTIPARNWIMRDRYVGGFVSVIVAKGGAGKSNLTMLDAVAIATNRPLTGYDIVKPGAVWIYNTEDPIDEIQRRLVAISMHHKIPLDEMHKVHVASGREKPFILAKASHDGIVINQTAIDAAVEFITKNGIVLLVADPFVRTHEANENDNMQIDKVVYCFQRIADRTGCAIALVHHTSKGGNTGASGEMDSARGASALVYASRIAHTLNTMSEEDAVKFSIQDTQRFWFTRLDNAKANMSKPAERADWFKKISVTLMNTDDVGTLEKIDLKTLSELRAKEQLETDAVQMAEFIENELKLTIAKPMDVTEFLVLLNSSELYGDLSQSFMHKDKLKRLRKIMDSGLCRTKNFTYGCKFFNEPKQKLKVFCLPVESADELKDMLE